MTTPNPTMMELLACPKCKGPFETVKSSPDLTCINCGTKLEYKDGVFYSEIEATDENVKQTIEEFGRRWNYVYKNMGGLKDFLLPMIHPVEKSFFLDKIIIDGGGGFGRLTKIMLDYGAKHVVLLDASTAVIAASEYLKDYKGRVTIVKGDLLNPPLAAGGFDLFFCHGVLHHTGEPKRVIMNMSNIVKPDTGSMILWVYAKEGNGLLSRLINLGRISAHMVGDRGKWWVASTVDIVLRIIWLLYVPLDRIFRLKNHLWYGEYFLDFLFNPQINNKVDRLQMYHDFLTTSIVEYYSRSQLEEWINEAKYKVAKYFFYRGQSWSVAASYNKDEKFS